MSDIRAFLNSERVRIEDAVGTSREEWTARGSGMVESTFACYDEWKAGRNELERALRRVLRRVSVSEPSLSEWTSIRVTLTGFIDEQLATGIRSHLSPDHRQKEFDPELLAVWGEELKADAEFIVKGRKAAIKRRCFERWLPVIAALVGALVGAVVGCLVNLL